MIVILGILLTAGLYYYVRSGSSYDGYYRTKGYGLALSIKRGVVKSYQLSGHHLVVLPNFKGRIKRHVLKSATVDLVLKPTHEGFEARNDMGTLYFKAEKISDLKAYTLVKDPEMDQIIFYETFSEHYPFFQLYDVNWSKMKNEKDMFVMVNNLNDDHVMMVVDGKEQTPYRDLPKWHQEGMSRALVQVVEKNYVRNIMYSKDRLVRHGFLNDQLGYILLASFGGYDHEAKATKYLSDAFYEALKDMKNKTIVLDLRFNRGGYDRVGLEMVRYFVKERTEVYQRAIKYDEGFLDKEHIIVEPHQRGYFENEMIILTSGATVSAAETFIVAMKAVKDVTIIGEETAGFYSDRLDRILPGGMIYGLPHMMYFDVLNQSLEGRPIVPDREEKISTEAVDVNRDLALESILADMGKIDDK